MMKSVTFFTKRRLLELALAVILLIAARQTSVQASPATQEDKCQAIVSHALYALQDVCSPLHRNKAWYGNNHISTVLDDAPGLKFQDTGDIIPINVIRTLITDKLD